MAKWVKCGECDGDILAKVHLDGTVESIPDCSAHN